MSSKDEIIEKLSRLVEQNLANEGFGVEELAEEMAISRSTLLRTIKKHTSVSANQFIRDIRLQHARMKLSDTELTVAEIAFETGFRSPSYFIKCFKEKYGFSPGEARSGDVIEESKPKRKLLSSRIGVIALLISISAAFTTYFIYISNSDSYGQSTKSIAVLPFLNESADSTNIYFVNGMMESILSHLQRIENLRVISRTSVEKYRGLRMTAPEIARELGVSYIVEGSGQKIDNSILLTVQLIDAEEDRHLWSEQYNRELSDVFVLQANVSQKIAQSIQAVIKPEEIDRIKSIPTENLQAYDLFLKGKEFLNEESAQALDSGLSYFEKAIALDQDFANPYAYAGICYYYKDFLFTQKRYSNELGSYSDKALLLNGELPEALISRGLYYMQQFKVKEAIEYFDKVLEYNPNSAWTHNFLSEIYNLYLPDTEKYLIHSLSALQLDLANNDSNDVSNTHLIIANAFSQSGIMDKAKEHIEISLEYNPKNIFSNYVEIYIDLVKDLDLERAEERMLEVWKMDTSRLDVLKEMAKISYAQKDYSSAYKLYDQFLSVKLKMGYGLFPSEDITMAFVFRAVGDPRADSLRNSFKIFTEADQSIYSSLHYTLLHLYDGDRENALETFREFSKNEDYMYWILLMLEGDPLFESVSERSEFLEIFHDMKNQFEVRKNERIKKLERLGLI